MPAFEYRALDAQGRERKGLEEGDTARQVRQNLREREMIPIEISQVERRTRSGGRTLGPFRASISATDLALVTRQLATLTRSAIPLEEALHTVANQHERHRVKTLLLAVRSKVLEGYSLAEGLAEFPDAFPELFRATVAAGQQAGHLDRVLERLADYTERRQQLRQRIQLALLYPALLTLVALAVTIGLLTYVVPQVVQVFAGIGQQLPALTRWLIATSDFLREYGMVLAILLAIITYLFIRALRKPAIRMNWHKLLHRAPLAGRLMRGLNAARFARTMSILGSSGVPVLESLRIAGSVVTSLPMAGSIERATEAVREGKSLAASLEREKCLPPMVVHLIASGETTGDLDQMLERAAENQERELETLIAALMGLFEPLLILLMGAMVLVIVLAILLPIFELNRLVA